MRIQGVCQRNGGAKILRVIGDREKVERFALKLNGEAALMGKGLSLSKAVCIIGTGSNAEGVGIDRKLCMDMQIAKVCAAWRTRSCRSSDSGSVL